MIHIYCLIYLDEVVMMSHFVRHVLKVKVARDPAHLKFNDRGFAWREEEGQAESAAVGRHENVGVADELDLGLEGVDHWVDGGKADGQGTVNVCFPGPRLGQVLGVLKDAVGVAELSNTPAQPVEEFVLVANVTHAPPRRPIALILDVCVEFGAAQPENVNGFTGSSGVEQLSRR